MKQVKRSMLKKLAVLLCVLFVILSIGGTGFAAAMEGTDSTPALTASEQEEKEKAGEDNGSGTENDVEEEEKGSDEEDTGSSENGEDAVSSEEKESGKAVSEQETAYAAGALSYNGSDCTVKLTYGAEAKIPDGASLTVQEIRKDTEEYGQYLEKSGQVLEEEGLANGSKENIDARFFDITIMDGSREIEPAGPVSVDISCRESLPVSGDGEVNAVHFDEKGPEVLEADPKDNGGNVSGVSFETDSFSVFGIIYTVDFTWEVDGETYAYSLPGGGFVSLSELIKTLHVTDEDVQKFVSDIEKAEFSSPELVWIGRADSDTTVSEMKKVNDLECEYSAELTQEQIDEIDAQTVKSGDWALICKKPFRSRETLTVTMSSGERFEILVTDSQAKDPLGLDGQSYVIANGNYAVRAEETVNGGHTYLKRNSIATDELVVWKFVYAEKVFPADASGTCTRDGYYLYNESTGKYMKISGTSSGDDNRGITLVDTAEEASPLKVEYDRSSGKYRISNQQDGQSGLLNNFSYGYFGVSNKNTNNNDAWMTLMDPDNPTTTPGTVGTWDIKSDGIVLKLFDYSGTVTYNGQNQNIDDVWGSETNATALRAGTGINKGRSLLFSGSGLENQEAFNNFTGSKNGGSYYSGYVYRRDSFFCRVPVFPSEEMCRNR